MKKVLMNIFIISFIILLSNITLASNFYDIKGTMYEGVVDRVAKLRNN